jgi:hypothetical protein
MAEIQPYPLTPIWPQTQQSFGDWLFGWIGKGMESYPEQLNTDLSKTMLPQVWGAWQPSNSGMSYLQNMLTAPAQQGGVGIGQASPYSSMLMNRGGTGGVGNQMMQQMAQYGAPSQAGAYVGNQAQYGVTSKALGDLLAPYAQGWTSGAASWMQPFLSGPTRGSWNSGSTNWQRRP